MRRIELSGILIILSLFFRSRVHMFNNAVYDRSDTVVYFDSFKTNFGQTKIQHESGNSDAVYLSSYKRSLPLSIDVVDIMFSSITIILVFSGWSNLRYKWLLTLADHDPAH